MFPRPFPRPQPPTSPVLREAAVSFRRQILTWNRKGSVSKALAASSTIKIHFNGKREYKKIRRGVAFVYVWLWMYFFSPAIPNMIWEFPERSSSVQQGGTALPAAIGCNPAWEPVGRKQTSTGTVWREQSHEDKLLVWLSGQGSLLSPVEAVWNTALTSGEGSQRWQSNFNSSLETWDPVLSCGAGCVMCLGLYWRLKGKNKFVWCFSAGFHVLPPLYSTTDLQLWWSKPKCIN